jgi:hypothetical protein
MWDRVISAFTRVFRRAMPGHDEMGENFFDYTTTTLLTTYRAYARLYEPRSLRGVSGDILKAERGVASCGGGL